ncbi:nuclear transport factor 2 family protein [Ningiella sp. W23]|uniref:nuclear transport factor 2 family protein n=1 Tax=Ningiella sp. W23 TaxID=3023715 RepID=UPI0037569EDF
MNKWRVLLLGCVVIPFYSTALLSNSNADEGAVNAVMDGLHESASQADLSAYLGAFTENGVFMGTDDWERWSRPTTLDEYVAERFKSGTGWTYTPEVRHISFSDSGDTAWFDEIIVSSKWGRFRGTGVLTKVQDEWKIAHYSMTVLVANEAFFDVADINKEAFAERNAKVK